MRGKRQFSTVFTHKSEELSEKLGIVCKSLELLAEK